MSVSNEQSCVHSLVRCVCLAIESSLGHQWVFLSFGIDIAQSGIFLCLLHLAFTMIRRTLQKHDS